MSCDSTPSAYRSVRSGKGGEGSPATGGRRIDGSCLTTRAQCLSINYRCVLLCSRQVDRVESTKVRLVIPGVLDCTRPLDYLILQEVTAFEADDPYAIEGLTTSPPSNATAMAI